MRKFNSIFLFFVTLLSLFISVTGFLADVSLTARIFQLLFLPVTLFLILTSIDHVINGAEVVNRGTGLKRLLVYYCFIITTILIVVGFFSSTTLAQFISSLVFASLGIYFLFLILPSSNYSFIPQPAIAGGQSLAVKEGESGMKLDIDRRDFIKLIGTAGVLTFVFGLFNRRGVPFFAGSTPSTVNTVGTSTLTDVSGNKINPAQQSLTDNYSITEIDDATPTAFFGFINDKGQWYIMKEDATGAFRYAKGESNFEEGWARREKLTYDYFNNVF